MKIHLHFLPEDSFGLQVLSLPASVCVCAYVCQSQPCRQDNTSPIQARIIKFGLEVENTLIKTHIVLGGDQRWYPRSNLKMKTLLHFQLVHTITHHLFNLESRNLVQWCTIPWWRSLLYLRLIDVYLHINFDIFVKLIFIVFVLYSMRTSLRILVGPLLATNCSSLLFWLKVVLSFDCVYNLNHTWDARMHVSVLHWQAASHPICDQCQIIATRCSYCSINPLLIMSLIIVLTSQHGCTPHSEMQHLQVW